MSYKEDIGKVHGKGHTFIIVEHHETFDNKYYVVRDDGKQWGSYSSRSDAFRKAHDEAGPDAYEV